MGSTSDWDTMCHAAEVLERFNVPFEKEVVSAHRTPVWMAEFAQGAEARGIQVIIAGAARLLAGTSLHRGRAAAVQAQQSYPGGDQDDGRCEENDGYHVRDYPLISPELIGAHR